VRARSRVTVTLFSQCGSGQTTVELLPRCLRCSLCLPYYSRVYIHFMFMHPMGAVSIIAYYRLRVFCRGNSVVICHCAPDAKRESYVTKVMWQRPDNRRTPSTVLALFLALALLFKSLHIVLCLMHSVVLI
jgi:hypothetical protein